MLHVLLLVLCSLSAISSEQVANARNSSLSSLYNYYASDGIQTPLVAKGTTFELNGRYLRIISATIHYFRIHPAQWRDRLRKARAAGINTIDTYVPWNLHEPEDGVFDFGQMKNDFSELLNLKKFIELVKEEDLFLILRPGPYICAEWEFGGMPSWLLRDPDMVVRSSYPGFLNKAKRYLEEVGRIAKKYQFSTQYGAQPLIMVQIENEFGHLGVDRPNYMKSLCKTLTEAGFNHALHFTSDSLVATGSRGTLPGIFITVNAKDNYERELEVLQKMQPLRPLMVTEFWTGWYDAWFNGYHNHDSSSKFIGLVEKIMKKGASIGFYMFNGGTNFGFMNGAFFGGSGYQPDATTYDYGAPLSENGDYTENYWVLREFLLSNYKLEGVYYPTPPERTIPVTYPSVEMTEYLSIDDLILRSGYEVSSRLTGKYMENLNINSGSGQSYGYTAYSLDGRLTGTEHSKLMISGAPKDIFYVIANNNSLTEPISGINGISKPGYWGRRNPEFELGMYAKQEISLIILAENMGRVNWGNQQSFDQPKGLGSGEVYLDNQELGPWKISSLEFHSSWLKSLKGWRSKQGAIKGPVLVRGFFQGKAGKDTFIAMDYSNDSWLKGQAFINGFNLGRYWSVGPTKTLYVPGPLVKDGLNELMVFELFTAGDFIDLVNEPNLG